MSDNDKGSVHGTSEGGVAGTHDPVDPIELLLGPATEDQLNTIHLGLISVGCLRVEDGRFTFDSSFVSSDPGSDKKDIRAELQLLVSLLKKLPESPLSVFGHADPVGTDEYNKQLSGRRATVIYALLISGTDPDTAVKLWQGVSSQEKWGANQRQSMEAFTGLPAGTPDRELFKAYMQKLCPAELKLAKKDFLAQGADPQGKGDFQGCSEFNPVLIFSAKKNSDFEKAKDKTARDDANAPNRRVMVLLFQKGSKVDPAKWPCPRVTEGGGELFKSGCKKRFFADGEKNRNTRLPEKDRNFDDKNDTFACRFYHRLLTRTKSPCESTLSIVKIRLFDPQARPLPFAPCLVTQQGKDPQPDRASGAPPSPLGTTPKGTPGSPAANDKEEAYIILRVKSFPATVNVKWSRPKQTEGANAPLPNKDDPDDFEYELDVAIDIPEADPDVASRTRLKNLGYDVSPSPPRIPIPGLGDPIKAFQRDYKLVVDGTLSQPTINAIKTAHDAADPVLKAGSDIAMER